MGGGEREAEDWKRRHSRTEKGKRGERAKKAKGGGGYIVDTYMYVYTPHHPFGIIS
jgi:hypothetical protein